MSRRAPLPPSSAFPKPRFPECAGRLEQGSKPFELAVLFVRLFRSLDAITGGDETVSRAWLKNFNSALDGKPLEKILTISGLFNVIAYLDSRRALV